MLHLDLQVTFKELLMHLLSNEKWSRHETDLRKNRWNLDVMTSGDVLVPNEIQKLLEQKETEKAIRNISGMTEK